jgi:hypothetical protein
VIVQLRGGNGAGKSTTVRRMLVEHDANEVEPKVWRCVGDLYVVGRYNLDLTKVPGAGGDHLSRGAGEGYERVRGLAERVPHLIFEGYGVSTTKPKDWALKLGVVQAFIQLSDEQVAARLEKRQREAGKPVGPPSEYVLNNWRAIRGHPVKREAEGYPVVRIPGDEDLYDAVHDLLVSGGWECDRHPVHWEYDWETRTRSRVSAAV